MPAHGLLCTGGAAGPLTAAETPRSAPAGAQVGLPPQGRPSRGPQVCLSPRSPSPPILPAPHLPLPTRSLPALPLPAPEGPAPTHGHCQGLRDRLPELHPSLSECRGSVLCTFTSHPDRTITYSQSLCLVLGVLLGGVQLWRGGEEVNSWTFAFQPLLPSFQPRPQRKYRHPSTQRGLDGSAFSHAPHIQGQDRSVVSDLRLLRVTRALI